MKYYFLQREQTANQRYQTRDIIYLVTKCNVLFEDKPAYTINMAYLYVALVAKKNAAYNCGACYKL